VAMSRFRSLIAAAGATAAAAAMTAVGAAGVAGASPKPAERILPGSAASFVSHTRPAGEVVPSTRLTIQLWLRPDLAAAARFATAVSTPGSTLFHHYLSPAAYTARFGTPRAVVSRVESWLRAEGFTAVHTDPGVAYVQATAPVSAIDAAFRVRLDTYKASAAASASPYTLYANDRQVSLPSYLAGGVLGVTGLDNAGPVIPLAAPRGEPGGQAARTARAGAAAPACSHYYGQHMATGLPKQFGTTSFPTTLCGYSADQMRAAYRASWANTGKGQTVALVELGLTKDMFLTLQDYAKVNRLPAPSSQRYEELSLGSNTCGDPFNFEEQLDVEISHDMAPDANQLVVGGDSCNDGDFGFQGLFDADEAVIDGAAGHPLATIVSNSWATGGPLPFLIKIEHSYLVRAAAEGVGMYFAAGDSSGVLFPAGDPFAIAVGGTTLGLGKTSNRLFETGWSDGASRIKDGKWVLLGEEGASGGGPSTPYPQPAYQKGVVPKSFGTTRSVPDISADADLFTGMALGFLSFPKGSAPTYQQIPIGGTSQSSPLVAGMVTAAQQGQETPFGFINPAIYKLYRSSAFFDTLPLASHSPALHRGMDCDIAFLENLCGHPPVQTLITFDDQNPKMTGYTGQITLKGYDNMTGLGTPDGPNFITALRKLNS
jgi:subtilase family serine protease